MQVNVERVQEERVVRGTSDLDTLQPPQISIRELGRVISNRVPCGSNWVSRDESQRVPRTPDQGRNDGV